MFCYPTKPFIDQSNKLPAFMINIDVFEIKVAIYRIFKTCYLQ